MGNEKESVFTCLLMITESVPSLLMLEMVSESGNVVTAPRST